MEIDLKNVDKSGRNGLFLRIEDLKIYQDICAHKKFHSRTTKILSITRNKKKRF